MKNFYVIKKMLGKNEKVMKGFSISQRFLKIKNFVILSVCFVVLIIIGFAVSFLSSSFSPSTSNEFEVAISFEEASPSFDYSSLYLWLILAAIFLLVIFPISWFYHFYYLKISNQYFFTNRRIIIKKGWLSYRTSTIHYNRITDATVSQDIIDRIIGIGTVSISTAGQEGYKLILAHIEKPNELKRELYNLKEKYQEELFKGNPQAQYHTNNS